MKPILTLAVLCAALTAPFCIQAQCGVDPTNGTTTINTASTIVNSYFPGTSTTAAGLFTLSVGSIDGRGNAAPLVNGDLVLIMQMQGADYNASNSSSYGNAVAGGDASGYLAANLKAGKYEYNTVSSVSGGSITFTRALVNDYAARSFSAGTIQTYQVIRIPRNYDLVINSGASVTAPAWNGATGGVVVLDAAHTMTINGSVNTTGLGFRGGGGMQMTGATTGNSNGTGTLTNTDFRWNSPQTNAANLSGGAKGEGISGTPVYTHSNGSTVTATATLEGYTNGSMGRGAPGNAGGGSTDGSPVGAGSQNQYNTGGGGGGNGGGGGTGGSGWHGGSGSSLTYPTGGYGAVAFAERQTTQFVMGGGGGAGSANNSTAANQYMSSGGTGGGIIIVRANVFAGNGSLQADGSNAPGVTGSGGNTDAAGGGGAGGTILAVTRQAGTAGLDNINASARGGNGGNMETHFDHGPGGGGGGGVIITNGAFLSANINAGSNGFTRAGNTTNPVTNTYGSFPGSAGVLITLALAPQQVNTLHPSAPCTTLPVTIVSFTAAKNNGTTTLAWQVTDAVNFSSFDITYSTDGINFSALGNVPYQTQKDTYSFVHASATGNIYYRLKLIDQDGSYSYSKIILVKEVAADNTLQLYPQPANNFMNVQVSAVRSQQTTVKIYTMEGRLVNKMNIQLNAGNNSFIIDKLSGYATGTYSMSILIDGKMQYKKLIVQH